MKFVEQFRMYMRMDFLISKSATGSREEFANRMNLSTTTLHRHIEVMKNDFGAPIKYDKRKCSYRYTKSFSLRSQEFLQSFRF